MPARRDPRQKRSRRFFKPSLLVLAGGVLALLALAFMVGPAAWIFWDTDGQRYEDITHVPNEDVALVFGAGLKANGTPSDLLSDRIHAAVLLYQNRKVHRLLMSGDGRSRDHDEPAAMARQAQSEGVPPAAIQRDPEGIHTIDSCRRAHDVYAVQTAVAVSQSYHLPRAIYACEKAGIRTVGFSLARVPYAGAWQLRAREVVSLDVAWWKLMFP
jgi:vancomycin permeability regulator SanA